MTVNHYLVSMHGFDDIRRRRPLAQRCEMRGLNIRSLIFVGFTAVEQKHRYSSIIGTPIDPTLDGGNINFHSYIPEKEKNGSTRAVPRRFD
jgi:hypothetical protein